ncbi:MAG TPA: tRNA (adenosine(37)-N6)-dimethylallyltransferase MiaA [Prolixibacteraceae bacterium]|nr:tRNA (adenosine(37)-N6)-dimethylallyltransferase MiaA [Prolixibacteraceae bacterium]
MANTLIIVLGPTAVGKTSRSIQIARWLNTEIISADSRQIYKELSIGTAVPDSQQLHTVKHHMIHNHSIHEYYNASHYEREALLLIENLFQKKQELVVCGGSMMYIDVLCNSIDDLPDVDPVVRNNLLLRYEKEGLETFRMELKKIDPDYYAVADLKNPRRILHALEIFYTCGKKYSTLLSAQKKKRDFHILKIGLNLPRAQLHQRINERVDRMVAGGLLEEARSVYPQRNLNSLKTVGYAELFAYFDGKISLDQAVEQIKRNTRRYARRQLTWFNRDKEITWFEPDREKEIMEFIQCSLQNSCL